MTLIDGSSDNYKNGFLQFLLQPESSPGQGRPTAYFKDDIVQASQSTNVANHQRRTWSFLTLGIPAMIEAFSIFLRGITHRDKTGDPLRIRFKTEYIPPDSMDQFKKFQRIYDGVASVMSESERSKAFQIIQKFINTHEAEGKADIGKDPLLQEKIRPYLELLEKCHRPKATRSHFNAENWKTLDLIDFELLQETFYNLTEVYNSDWMIDSGLQDAMKNDFGFNYYEALIAENLSLYLAYIEGIDQKVIQLPVFDPKIGMFRSVEFMITENVLGDSLPCFILESNDPIATPWFVVRGTQYYTGLASDGKELRKGSLESILADSLDHESITRHVINKALVTHPLVRENGVLVQKESLSDLFRKLKNEGCFINLCGHSLGGTLVNALTVDFYDQVKTAYSFSGSGVSDETAENWEKLIKSDSSGTFADKLINFDYEGDFVPSGGRKIIGKHYAIMCVVFDRMRSLYESHVTMHLNRDFQIQKVDVIAENRKFSRQFMERVRIIVGKCFGLLLRIFNKTYIPDWWSRRKEYQMHAALERTIRLEQDFPQFLCRA